MRENDWLVAGINNPEFSTNDFFISGLNVGNTQMLTKDEYKDTALIKDQFTEDGVFNEEKFDAYYNLRLLEYNQLSYLSNTDTLIYDPFDTATADKSKLTSGSPFEISLTFNPTKDLHLLSGESVESGLSFREVAQQNNIYDTATLSFLDESANDRALVNSPLKWIKQFSDPLVYATYQEDGEHYDIFTDQMVKHRKGDYKFNSQGTPYIETLDGRSLANKEVVSAWDTITVDNEGVDKYNFMDSDGIDKNIAGTITKTALTVAPLMFGGPVSAIYSGILLTKELFKTLPMLYGITTALVHDNTDNEVLNKLAGIGGMLSTSQSDYSKLSFFNAENISNLVADIALQYGQQNLIRLSVMYLRGSKALLETALAQAFMAYSFQRQQLEELLKKGVISRSKFIKLVGETADDWVDSVLGKAALTKFTEGTKKVLESSSKIGSNVALGYMALVSNTDVYQSMLEAGATKKEAAAVALGSTLGMFAVDKFTGLGELFFDDLTSETEHSIRRTLIKEAKVWWEETGKQAKNKSTKNFIKKGIDFGKKQASNFVEDLKYHSTGFFGKAVGEGLEEMSEELVADISKQLYELAGDLGFDTTTEDVGAFKDWHKRYATSFVGGALGGGLFYGVNLYNKGSFNVDRTLDELIYLVRNGHLDKALSMLDKMHKEGKLGSQNMSHRYKIDSDGKKEFYSAKSAEDSQNTFIYNRIKDTLLLINAIIGENKADMTDDELYENMILQESRFQELKDYLKGASYSTGYYDDYLNALKEVVNLEEAVRRVNLTDTGLDYTNRLEFELHMLKDEDLRRMSDELKQIRNANIQKTVNNLNNAKLHLNNFVSGKYSLEYLDKMLFALDTDINSEYYIPNFELWLNKLHDGKTLADLTDDEREKYANEYRLFLKAIVDGQKASLTQAYKSWKTIGDLVDPEIEEIEKHKLDFVKSQKAFQEIEQLLQNYKIYNIDSVLDFDGETEESDSYKNRRSEANIQDRLLKINEKNTEELEKLELAIREKINDAGGYIDPIARNTIRLLLQLRSKDIKKLIINNIKLSLLQEDGELDEVYELIFDTLEKSEGDILKSSTFTSRLLEIIEDNIDIDNIVVAAPEGIYKALVDSGMDGANASDYAQYQDRYQEWLDSISDSTQKDKMIELLIEKISEYMQDNFEEELPQELIDAIKSEQSVYKGIEKFKALKVQSEYDTALNYVKSLLDSINENGYIKINNLVDKATKDINPIKNLIKKIAPKLLIDPKNIDELFNRLGNRFEQIENLLEFALTDKEVDYFKESIDLIKLIDSRLKAASATPSVLTPFGHNKTINQFAEKHKNLYPDYKKLPEISDELYILYANAFTRIYNQMGYWEELGNRNRINKIEQARGAENALITTLFNLFGNANTFKFDFNGKKYDLLEGVDTSLIQNATIEDLPKLNKLFDTFYHNVQKVIKDNKWTAREFWENTKLIDKIAKIEDIPLLHISTLDSALTIDKMTSYDKMVALCAIASMESTEFYRYVKSRINADSKIVPLTIQEWVTRINLAVRTSPTLFNGALDYVAAQTGTKLNVIHNTVYTNGDGGAGKSSVVGRNIANYKDGVVWLAAPKDSQVNNIANAVNTNNPNLNLSHLFVLRVHEGTLFAPLLTSLGLSQDYVKAYNNAIKDLNENKTNSEYYTINEVDGVKVVTLKSDKFNIKKVTNIEKPQCLIVDEGTHLSNLEIQILSAWCETHNVTFHILGDRKQNGFSKIGNNIDREVCFMIRTPNLGVSFRDNNIQHYTNLTKLGTWLDYYESLADDSPDYSKLISLLLLFNFNVYTKTDINGDWITLSIKEEDVKKMKGTIGFIGDENSSIIPILKNANANYVVVSPEDVQGQEFDYVIIDKQFQLPKDSPYSNYLFVKDLYTMISRGRNGSIIIDANKQLENVIGANNVTTSQGFTPKLLDFLDRLKELHLNVINAILNGVTTSTPPPTSTSQGSEDEEGDNGPLLGGTSNPQPDDAEEDDESGNDGEDEAPGGEDEELGDESTEEESESGGAPLDEDDDPLPLKVLRDEEDELDNWVEASDEEKSGIPEKNQLPGTNQTDDTENMAIANMIDPMLCYGLTTLTGCPVDIENDKEVWNINTGDDILRDAMLFLPEQYEEGLLDDQGRLIDSSVLFQASQTLRKMKRRFLYKKSYDQIGDDLKALISEEDYNNIVWKLEVRPVNNDNFIRNIGFLEVKGLIKSASGLELMFSVVGEIKLKNGRKGLITLGMVGSPDSWDPKNDSVKKQSRLDKRIKRLERQRGNIKINQDALKEEIKKLKQQKQDITVKADRLRSLIETLRNNYNHKGLPLYYLLPKDSVKFTGMPHLLKRQKPIRLLRITPQMIKSVEKRITEFLEKLSKLNSLSKTYGFYERRIKGLNKLKKELEEGREFSFHVVNPGVTSSAIYNYTVGSKNIFENLDSSNSGKYPIIFMTTDDTLNGDKLVDLYITNQELFAATSSGSTGFDKIVNSPATPNTRAVILNHMGVSFSDLSNPFLLEAMASETLNKKGEKQKNIFPFKTHYTGTRMFVGLWNFRANLLNFVEKTREFKLSMIEKYQLPNELAFDTLLIYKDLKYRANLAARTKNPKHKLDHDSQLFLTECENRFGNEFDQFFNDIDAFNNNTLRNLRQFRLGGSLKGLSIRYLWADKKDINTDLYSDKKLPSGIYITSVRAEEYLSLIESIFTNILDPLIHVTHPTLNYEEFKTKILTERKGFKNSILNATQLILNGELVMLENSSDNDLEALEINIKFDNNYSQDLNATSSLSFSHIPAVLSKANKYIQQLLYTDDENKLGVLDHYTIDIKYTENGEKKGKTISYSNIYNSLPWHDPGRADNILESFFALAFHGSVEPISNTSALRATDANFPYGFFVDPLSSVNEVTDTYNNKVFVKTVDLPWFYSIDVDVQDPTFFIQFDTTTALSSELFAEAAEEDAGLLDEEQVTGDDEVEVETSIEISTNSTEGDFVKEGKLLVNNTLNMNINGAVRNMTLKELVEHLGFEIKLDYNAYKEGNSIRIEFNGSLSRIELEFNPLTRLFSIKQDQGLLEQKLNTNEDLNETEKDTEIEYAITEYLTLLKQCLKEVTNEHLLKLSEDIQEQYQDLLDYIESLSQEKNIDQITLIINNISELANIICSNIGSIPDTLEQALMKMDEVVKPKFC